MTSTTPIDAGYRPAGDAAVRALTDAVSRVHLPGTASYARLTRTQNPTLTLGPLAVVEATDASEVATTLRLAAAFGVRVGVQGTGHGPTDTMDGALLVSTATLDELTIDLVQCRARIGAGVRWSAVLEAAAPYGLAPVCGSSTHVGVVGLLTGGGVGPLARSHGLASDHVHAFEVVTGDGEVRRATRVRNADLFWALRGGKGALGIVTAVELDLPSLSQVYGGAIYFAGEDAAAVVRTWGVWAQLLPEQATTSLAVLRLPDLDLVPPPLRGRTAVAVRFVWTGDPDEGGELVRAVRSAATPLVDTVGVMPYAAIASVHADPEDPIPSHDSTFLLEEFGPEVTERFLELVGPGTPCVQAVVEVRQLGGRVRTGDDCAFAHRDAPYSVFTTGIAAPGTAPVVADDARRIAAGLAPWARAGSMPNFTTRSGRAFVEAVHPPAVAARLHALSLAYDPSGVLLAARGLRD
ncbi:FAD-binding oxidoreductase [Cellulomonas palmilytica]|uniref:FAD-binding oxidoreductase n=1 Tax=Cellulomonas palmilytica TaxID=2608402 RepID=UPI001F385A86|nr:FAD-binding oxidoreductase [Cellulomonas palmilytica]UJP39979.1 FAD-binding oxidoreductase [Cellulomonas palmilytica]